MRATVLALLLFCIAWGGAVAHESLPVYLGVTETGQGGFDVQWRIPATQGAAPALAPSFPDQCKPVTAANVSPAPGMSVGRMLIRCGAPGLTEGRIAVAGLESTLLDALVQIKFADGTEITQVLRPNGPSLLLAGRRQSTDVWGYFHLGVEHILLGVDHLLFVIGLVLIVRRLGRLVQTITAFTVAHSLTLALATLGFVHVPPAPVEATIALSIVFLARELVRVGRGEAGLTARFPWIVAFTFGLLHGFGFAGALSEVGLPAHDIPLALLLFNLGVEAGQLLFVAALLALRAVVNRFAHRLPRFAGGVPAYGIGAAAGFWLIERLAVIL
jgi:hydrogenase/urease accessory protein HupE